MVTRKTRKNKAKRPSPGRPAAPREPGLSPLSYTAAAGRLGCSKAHLWYVLNGVRESKRLKARYRALVEQETETRKETR
jgi:hypothetical protein